MSEPAVPVLSPDFNDPSFAADPWPVLEEIRATGRVVYHEKLDQYMVTGYRDVARVYGDAERFRPEYDLFIRHFGAETMECMDDPRHAQVRGVWAADFRRDAVEAQRALVAEVVDQRLAGFLPRLDDGGPVDVVAHLTRGIPTMVIAHLLGVPREHHERFTAWSDAMGLVPEGKADPTPRGERLIREGQEGTRALNEYLAAVVRDRRERPGDDLVSRMTSSPVFDTMTFAEVVASNTQLVFAGNETTAKLMAMTLIALDRHPDQKRAVVADRSLIPQTIEEAHRWDPVVHLGWRYVRTDEAPVGDVTLPKDAKIMGLNGAAARDPQRWPDPARFDIFRPQRQHLGFGFGMHSCLGLNLARLEAQVWLDRFLDHLPDYRVHGEVEFGGNWVIRGPARLLITRS